MPQRAPDLIPMQPFSFLKLPAETRHQIYIFAWDSYRGGSGRAGNRGNCSDLAIGCGGFCFYNLREFGLLFANSQIYHEDLPIVASRCVIKISSTWDLSGNRRVLAEVLKWEAKFRGFGPKVIVDV